MKRGKQPKIVKEHPASDISPPFPRYRHRNRVRNRRNARYIPTSGQRKLILVGSPNVGKSVIFGALTGKYVDVSNYPGTSVEITSGELVVGDEVFELIDSPGINSLVPSSEDERVTLNIILDRNVAGIIQVIDAKNLKRGLLLTHQIAAMGFPLVVCLNIYDEALEKGIEIDVANLEKVFGVRFIPTIATKMQGIEELYQSLFELQIPHHLIHFHLQIEKTIENLSKHLSMGSLNPRGIAINVIASREIPEYLNTDDKTIDAIRAELSSLRKKVSTSPGYEIQHTIASHIEHRTGRYMKMSNVRINPLKEKIGWLTMHRWYGIPFILVSLFILYELVGVFGAGICVDFIESKVFGGVDSQGDFYGLINPAFIRFLHPLQSSQIGSFFYDLLVGEYGAITVGLTYSVAIVFPVVSLFFIFFGIMEDSGYLPRLTVMSNRLFQRIGLNGRAVLPMVLGLGCDTMATFTTRILETKKERNIATLLLALGIPCSAQLGVILGMMSAISLGLLFIVILTVAMQLFIVGYAAAKFIPGKTAPLLAEVPPLRLPRIRNILLKTYFRVKLFMKEAVPLFIIGTMALFFLDRVSLLLIIENAVSPVITGFLQLPAEATEAFIIGFLRRDYGAAGLFFLVEKGLMDHIQITVGITVMVLFVPCLANFFVIIKERGLKTAGIMSTFIIIYAVLIGGILNLILRLFL